MENETPQQQQILTDLRNNLFNKIPFSITNISITIVVLSIIKHILYYKNYNVPIEYFLGFSGLGIIISEDLLLILPFLLLYFMILLLSYILGRYYHGEKRTQINNSEVKDSKKKPKQDDSFVLKILLAITLTLILGLIVRFFTEPHYYIKIGYFAIIFLGLIIVTLISISSFIHRIPIHSLFSFIFFSLLFGAFLFKVSKQIKEVENGKYDGTKIMTTDTTYSSTASSYFIGKTEKYVFVYDKNEKATSILPVESIKKILLKSK